VQETKETYGAFTNSETNLNFINNKTVESTPNLAQAILKGFEKHQQQQEALQEVLTLVREVHQPPAPATFAREESLPFRQER